MIKRRTPLKRSTKPIPRKRSKPRRGPMRDLGYLQFLREECKCIACVRDVNTLPRWEMRCTDPAHYRVNGRSSKGPDNEAIPLCRMHHLVQTAMRHDDFAAKIGFDWKQEAAAHYALYLIHREQLA